MAINTNSMLRYVPNDRDREIVLRRLADVRNRQLFQMETRASVEGWPTTSINRRRQQIWQEYHDRIVKYDSETRPYMSYNDIVGQAMLDASHDAEGVQDEDDQQQGEMIMNLLNTKIVGVKFTNGNSDAPGYDKQYHYLTDDLSIKVDDYCIVVAPSGAPAVVKVYDANAVSSRFDPLKMVLCKIDMDSYREKQRIVVQRAAAIKRLEQIEKEQTAQERFKKLALVSDEAAELLKVLGVISPPTSIEGVAANQAIGDEQNNTVDGNAE